MAAQPVLLTMFNLRPELRETLSARYRLVGPLKAPLTDVTASALHSEIAVVITLGPIGLSQALINALPNLALIAVYGAGYENVDMAAAEMRGIPVTNGGASNASCVADTAMALLLALILGLPKGDAIVRSGRWDRTPPRNWVRQPGVGGKRMGVLGLGNIGSRVAARAQAFELEIGYHNRSKRTNVDYAHFPNVFELATWADYLVVAAPGSQATTAIVDASVLRALGPRGYLINVARGSLVDENALVEALEAGGIAGAGLDVFADEPRVSMALRNAPNTVFMPHMGGFSTRAADNMDALLLDNIAAHFEGRPLLSKISL